jgi:hypothetical protein
MAATDAVLVVAKITKAEAVEVVKEVAKAVAKVEEAAEVREDVGEMNRQCTQPPIFSKYL